MNSTAVKYGASALPGVNLLPQEIAERKKMRTVIAGSAIAVVGAIVLMALTFATVMAAKSSASSDRAKAVNEELAAVQARDAMRPVYDAVTQREAAEYTLAQIGLGEMDYAKLIAAIQTAQDTDTSFEEIIISGPNAAEVGGTEPEGELYGSGVGVVQFKARAVSMETATALVGRLEEIPGIANVRTTVELYSVDGADTFYSVEGRGTLTTSALTMRLVPTSGLSDVEALIRPQLQESATAEPSPTPSPAPSAAAGEEG